ncbi:unnamed protein product [Gordionus sp. m RMFG-2023]|uniref:bone morphogenetic protein receptor type-1A-like n=1 Tax=Gordionus sp. m RMFG-2023 TaxID=3053472 RepID=UPI0030E5F33E
MVEGCSYSFKEVKTVCCDSNFCNQIDSILTDITSIDNFTIIKKNPQTELWKGKYQNDNVAIKCYMPGASSSWERELKIYKSASSRNNNILRYIGADISRYYYCIVFDYYDNQSLYDFLRCPKNSMFGLSLNQIYMIAYTASKGLSYLHSNIFGADPKPTICHRDIKSKNILIKSICGNLNATINLTPIPRNKYQSDHCINYTKDSNLNKSNNNDKTYCSINCCISDLGLAITDDEDYSSIKLKVGTHRYMSPEILSETLDRLNFESFKMSDVYSFALVLWEIISCYNPFYPNPPFKLNCFHELPYHEFVSQNPSLDDMKTIVVDKNLRPSLQFNWYKSEKILPFLEIIKESWSSNPKSRLSAIRIKLTLQKSCSGMSII